MSSSWIENHLIMMTSSKGETFSALLALCAGNSQVSVNSAHKGQWRGTLMFSLLCVWINHWVNNHEAGDLRRHRCHYDVNVMWNGPMTLRQPNLRTVNLPWKGRSVSQLIDIHSSIKAIHKSFNDIMDIHNSNMDVYNSIKYIHNSITDIQICIMEK